MTTAQQTRNEDPIANDARMSTLTRIAQRTVADQRGQTTTDHGVVGGVVVIALAAAVPALQAPIESLIGKVADGVARLP